MNKINATTSHGQGRNTHARNSPLKCRTLGLFTAGIILSSCLQFANAAEHKGKPFVAIDNQLIEVQGAVSSLEAQVALLVGQVATVEEHVAAAAAAIESLQDQNAALTLLVNENMSSILSIQDGISLLQQESEAIHADIVANAGIILEYQQAQLDANAMMITDLQQALILVENNSVSLGDSLQAQIDANFGLIEALQSDIEIINAGLLEKQRILEGNCPTGYALEHIAPNGALTCVEVGVSPGQLQGLTISHSIELNNIFAANWFPQCPDTYTAVSIGWTNAVPGVQVINSQCGAFAPDVDCQLYLKNETDPFTNRSVGGKLRCIRIAPPVM